MRCPHLSPHHLFLSHPSSASFLKSSQNICIHSNCPLSTQTSFCRTHILPAHDKHSRKAPSWAVGVTEMSACRRTESSSSNVSFGHWLNNFLLFGRAILYENIGIHESPAPKMYTCQIEAMTAAIMKCRTELNLKALGSHCTPLTAILLHLYTVHVSDH